VLLLPAAHQHHPLRPPQRHSLLVPLLRRTQRRPRRHLPGGLHLLRAISNGWAGAETPSRSSSRPSRSPTLCRPANLAPPFAPRRGSAPAAGEP
jgi:hypothetical protein